MHEGVWVFDDPELGLEKEALVAGMEAMIYFATQELGIEEPERGFVATFSDKPFPDYRIKMLLVGQETGEERHGWHTYEALGVEGSLCPALFKYFKKAPKAIYVELRNL